MENYPLEAKGAVLAPRLFSVVEVLKAGAGMDFFENPYYRFYKFHFTSVALWPDQNVRFIVLWRILISCILGSFLVLHVLKLCTMSKDNMDLIFGTASTLMLVFSVFVKYLSCWMNLTEIKELLNRIKKEWCTTMPKSEMKIICEYTQRGRVYARFYAWITYTGVLIFCMRLLLPDILNIFLPFNIPRFMYKPVLGEYFVNVDDYFFLITLHITTVSITVAAITVAVDTVFIALMFHACGMFSVVGHRLQHAFDKDAPDSCAIDKSHKAVVRILEHHKRTIKYVRIMASSCRYFHLIQLFVIVINLSCLMFHLSNALSKMDTVEDIVITITHIICTSVLVFINCLPGQELLDCSSDIFRKAYHGLWYTASSRSKKILLLIMLRTMQPTAMTAANIFTISYQMFGTMMQSSMSYFMVLYSISSQSK